MAINWTTNVALPGSTDKVGGYIMTLRNALVASGFWRVRGSGDGNGNFQLMGQTTGVNGSYDVFTSGVGWAQSTAYNALPNTISNINAWIILEEIASGRCIYFQRYSTGGNSNTTTYTRGERGFATGGVASTGANHFTMPARQGTVRLFSSGNTDTGQFSGFEGNSTTEWWMHVGVTDNVRPGNVAPFFAVTVSRTNGAGGLAWMHESLSDYPASESAPYWHGMGTWNQVWGAIGTGGNMNHGDIAFSGTSAGYSRGDVLYSTGLGMQASGVYAPIDSDGRWRTQRVIVRYSPSRNFIGRTEHLLYNLVSREYPSTYGVATATPYLACGHFLLPWKTGVAPNFTP